MDNAITAPAGHTAKNGRPCDGALIAPARYGDDGWEYYNWNPTPEKGQQETFRALEMCHLYHASGAAEDRELIETIRRSEAMFSPPTEGPPHRLPGANRFSVEAIHPLNDEKDQCGWAEFPRFAYYQGVPGNEAWPEKVMEAELAAITQTVEQMQADDLTMEEVIATNVSPPNVVLCKGLTQVTMGCPHTVYNGGLCRATVRYFDARARRPGLPPGCAALVDSLSTDMSEVGVELCNLGDAEQELVVQAGAFGEHSFTSLAVMNGSGGAGGGAQPIGGKHFMVVLPPRSKVRCVAGLRRFVNDPSYRFPWHSRVIPVPFQ